VSRGRRPRDVRQTLEMYDHDRPVVRPHSRIAGALMSFITAINELSSSLILYVGRTMTMPVRIYLSVLDGQFGTASALSTILLAATGLAVFVVFRISDRKESAFV
jgi:iron(III) transport system permease protein